MQTYVINRAKDESRLLFKIKARISVQNNPMVAATRPVSTCNKNMDLVAREVTHVDGFQW